MSRILAQIAAGRMGSEPGRRARRGVLMHRPRRYQTQREGQKPTMGFELPVIATPDGSGDATACGAPTAGVFEPSRRLPPWLKRDLPKGNFNNFTAGLLDELRLETVCDNAKCPNRMECYSQK